MSRFKDGCGTHRYPKSQLTDFKSFPQHPLWPSSNTPPLHRGLPPPEMLVLPEHWVIPGGKECKRRLRSRRIRFYSKENFLHPSRLSLHPRLHHGIINPECELHSTKNNLTFDAFSFDFYLNFVPSSIWALLPLPHLYISDLELFFLFPSSAAVMAELRGPPSTSKDLCILDSSLKSLLYVNLLIAKRKNARFQCQTHSSAEGRRMGKIKARKAVGHVSKKAFIYSLLFHLSLFLDLRLDLPLVFRFQPSALHRCYAGCITRYTEKQTVKRSLER